MSYLKTTVVGYLGNDCRVSTVNGKEVINLSLAHGEKFKDAQGVQRERTLWISASYWPERTTIAQYLKKGTLVLIEGKPDVGIYTDKSDKPQAEFKLRVSQIQLLGGKKEEGGGNGTQNSGNQYSNQQSGGGFSNDDLNDPNNEPPF